MRTNKFIQIRLLVGILLLSSCSVTQNRTLDQRGYRRDSATQICVDTKALKIERRSYNLLSATLRQTTYSAPDSTGRQYPLFVTTAAVHQSSEQLEQDTSRISSERKSSSSSTITESIKKQEKRKRDSLPSWMWITGGLALIGYAFIHRRNSIIPFLRNNRN